MNGERDMKKNKVLLTKTGDTYNCRYVLDQTDIIDEKVDKGVSGKFPQIIPCRLEEKDNQREFIYEIGNKVQLTEFLKKEINKKQMLTLLYNLLSGLEAFGMNMISLSYVAKDIQYVFVAPESLNVYFIVAGVDKEITDLNEVRNFVKDVICNAHYFEMDRDNYVARLITFTNKLGTFSVGDMKEFVNQLLIDMGIHIEEEKKKSSSYEALIEAYSALQQQNTDEAALKIQNVYADLLPADLKGIYNTICNTTGTTGIEGTTDAKVTDGTGSADSAEGDASSDSAEDGSYDDGSYDSGEYDDGSYDNSDGDSADDGSYDTGDYDDSGY